MFLWRHMRRAAALVGALLALALVSGAGAGGWATVILDQESASVGLDGGVVAGQPVTIGFTVLQHGKRPIDGLAPVITATSREAGERITFHATAEGGPGHYAATLTLPAAGVWEWRIDAFGPPATMAPMTVVAAAPAPAPAEAAATLPWALAVVTLVVAMALALVARARRPAPAS